MALVLRAPVVAVTLFEDRAQVTRRGRVELPPGSHRVRVEGVAPVVADRSLQASASGARVDEARVARRFRIGVEERPAATAALLAERDALVLELSRAEHEVALRMRRRAVAESAVTLLVASVDRSLPWATALDPAPLASLDGFLASLREADAALLAAVAKVRELKSRRDALELRLHGGDHVDHGIVADLEVDLSGDGGAAEVELVYLVPCALWRPAHRATLAGTRLRFACEAAVWQATGEDWGDVELSFSTARPTQRSEPPLLEDDVLHVRRRPEKKVEVQVREQAVATTGEGVSIEAAELPGVDDGGETRLLRAAGKATIASDGRLRRVPVFSFEADAEVDRLARPEKAALVHLRCRAANASPHPLLAGPVELLRESGYVGRTTLDFVAPGERFALGFGGDAALRVRRELREKRETATLTGKLTITRTVELFLSNLSPEDAHFRLEERVPVSELAQVEVSVDARETSPLAVPDADGIVGWPIRIPAHGTLPVKLVYRLTASSDVGGAL